MSSYLPPIGFDIHQAMRDFNKIPFPGKAAEFELTHDWNQLDFDANAKFVRSHSFLSKTYNSFFEHAKILGDKDGGITLYVTLQRADEQLVKNYFSENQINLDSASWRIGTHYAKSLSEKRSLFKILIENNSFPKEQVPFMQSLIDAENWYDVTPLQEGQTLPSKQIYDYYESCVNWNGHLVHKKDLKK